MVHIKVNYIHYESEKVVKMGYQKMGHHDVNVRNAEKHFKQVT